MQARDREAVNQKQSRRSNKTSYKTSVIEEIQIWPTIHSVGFERALRTIDTIETREHLCVISIDLVFDEVK